MDGSGPSGATRGSDPAAELTGMGGLWAAG